jgi:Rrf2 family iron-sulfur cluster assembly transcriptional regulator
MNFTKACEYGIRATIYISQQSMIDSRASLKDISKEIDSPEAFTAKILQMLVKHNIITSVKGSMGGFQIDQKKIKKIKLADIVYAIDGESIDKICVIGLKKCSEIHPCPVHHKYKHIKKDFLAMLESTKLFEMSESINNGLTCLKI